MNWRSHLTPRGSMGRTAANKVAALAALVLLSACTTVIVPPVAPATPASVFIVDHGRHTSLVLPHPKGIVRYAYGDWDWYAEVETGPAEATAATLWPTRAALGRRILEAPATEQGVRRALKVGIEQLHPVTVDAGEVAALRRRLDRLYRANSRTAKVNEAYDLTFVEHPVPYTACHNSNHRVALWLEQLGCTIRGSAFWSEWEVASPPQPPLQGN